MVTVLWSMPLVQAFAMLAAARVRCGKKLSGPSYEDQELAKAIDEATERNGR